MHSKNINKNIKDNQENKRKRKKKTRIEDLPISKKLDKNIEKIAASLCKQIDKDIFFQKHGPTAEILKLVAAGALAALFPTSPNLQSLMRPFLENEYDSCAWKRYNIPYARRTLKRLEMQKLIKKHNQKEKTGYNLTIAGRRKILKYALDEIEIKKPRIWNRQWYLISYDIPVNSKTVADLIRKYLKKWRFYPLHNSVYIHAYPCEQEVEFLRDYFGVSDCVRIFVVDKIENDAVFREFFDV